jgi:acyl-homoserine lactone acylase PvdQ
MGSKNGKWLSLQENNRSLNALIECWTRTKATNLKEYQTALSLLGNNSNNTVYADADGSIAYWHGNFIPKRNTNYDYSVPVDGSIKATNWLGAHALNEIVQSINPANGWLQNCNATPFTVAGASSPKEKDYPHYMAPDGENGRGINAVNLLNKVDKISLEDLIQLGYNKQLSAFDILLPSFMAYTKTIGLNERESKAINYLANWNRDAGISSVATTIAIEWANNWSKEIPPATTEEATTQIIKKYEQMVQAVSNEKKLALLNNALDQLEKTYGNWEIQWGDLNRYQRVNPGEKFNDNAPSIAVGQTSSKWGSLPAFESRRYDNTLKRYGYSGNSFIAAVSFGKKLEAKTIITGGQSRFANSNHFTDQAQKYIDGDFKTIHFYKEDVLAHAVTSYKPGFSK